MTRFWYTIRSDRGVWLSGWTFGESTDHAAQNAIGRETKYHPTIRQAPLKVSLQSVPDYDDAISETIYATVNVDALADAQKAG